MDEFRQMNEEEKEQYLIVLQLLQSQMATEDQHEYLFELFHEQSAFF